MCKILLTVLIVIVSFLLLVVVGIGAYVLYLLVRRPLVKFYNQRASESDFCPYDKIPAQLLYFIVQAEDEHFFSHRGIVLDSIQTAFRLNKRAHHIVMGGSTISQQLMKNLYFQFEQRYFRKLIEAILTFHAERVLGKEKILELYLNIIYFGNGQYGIVSAADYYFNKSVDELSTNQQFMLACIIHAPNVANPIKHPDYKKSLNKHALRKYLMFGYLAGNSTLFDGIEKLPAGHWLVYKNGDISLQKYYYLNYEPDFSRSEDEWIEEIENTALKILAEDQSDPKFNGAESFLSGGVDSSYLLALSDIQTACSIGYDNSDSDESQLAQITAENLGRNFRKRIVNSDLYFSTIPKVVSALGLPSADLSSVVFYLGCEDVSKRASMCFREKVQTNFLQDIGSINVRTNV